MANSQMLRILVDLSRLRPGGESGGVKPALLEMLRWLGETEKDAVEFVYVGDPGSAAEYSFLLRPGDRLVSMAEAPSDLAARENCHLVYCPFGITEWACPGIPTVTLIVDLLHRDFPQSQSEQDCKFREESMQTALARTDLFQVISDYTAGQIRKYYPVGLERIFRTYLPIHGRLPEQRRAKGSKVPRPYFFYPANAWVHKNHESLLVAYANYRQATGATAWRLVLTGQEDAPMRHIHAVAGTLGVSAHVDFLGYVDGSHLAALWDDAGALVFPSLHEGFGIPLLEAMARGVPILASRSTAIAEIVADAALLVDGRTPLALAQGMQQLAGDPELRLGLVERGRKRLADFTPEREFGRLLRSFHAGAAKPARWRQSGYYAVDGLIEPLAIFAIAPSVAKQELYFATRPLGVSRLLEFWCGSHCCTKMSIAAGVPTKGQVTLPPGACVLSLRVPDASRLSATDPRTHGVLLEQLQVTNAEGTTTDLLRSSTS